ncbi:MAG: chromate efflux transporter [Rhodospirillaceae bacterium]|jgi:chromate transporter|nr:chromate efflux transporter [Rhodospirillaceae bacterium]MBT6509828.1 chromate efflux transporter [Rhodospirillaceae bacterium]MBT7647917.1 chromate efflux transporter [Rhodospirillaceae bacterium]
MEERALADELQGHSDSVEAERISAIKVFLIFLRLGCTSFGGPVAHLGYFRDEFVGRRKWLKDRAYADLVALCQFLPGPASSQVGIGLGLSKAGLPGALAAWLGFTMPSALILIAFGYGVVAYEGTAHQGILHGLKVVAVAVVAQAVWGMAKNMCPDAKRATMAVLAAAAVLAAPTPLVQVGVIIVGGLAGLALLKADTSAEYEPLGINVSRPLAITSLALFFTALIGLPILVSIYPSHILALVESFYSSGSLVFGGGHVVLPLLQAEVVPTGWVSNDAFLAGYGAAQAVPGPLFTFAAYLGSVLEPVPNGLLGGLLCLVAIFVPSFLLVIGALPFWDSLRRVKAMQTALLGINAAVAGLLLAALYNPVWTNAIIGPADFALAIGSFTLLVFWKVPAWLVVILTALGGWLIAALPSILM